MADSTAANPKRKRRRVKRQYPSNWLFRRGIIIGTVIFCGHIIHWLTLFGQDNGLTREIVRDSYILAGSVILLYAFGRILEPAILAWATAKGQNNGVN